MQTEIFDMLSKRALVFGTVVWLTSLVAHLLEPSFFSQVESLLLFGTGIITPLAIRIVCLSEQRPIETRIYKIIWYFQPIVIIAITIAFMVQSVVLSGILTGFWVVQTLLLAICGLLHLQTHGLMIEELCISSAFLYIPISGLWLSSYNLNYPLLSFDKAFVLLTAVHFTFITMGALIIVGILGRQLYQSHIWKVYRVITALIIISPSLVAIGITVSQYSGRFLLETSSVVVFAGSLLFLSFLSFFNGLPENRIVRFLVFLSLMTLVMTMILALLYSFGRLTGRWSLSLSFMVQWHGWFNAIGFTFSGLLAWNIYLPSIRLSNYEGS